MAADDSGMTEAEVWPRAEADCGDVYPGRLLEIGSKSCRKSWEKPCGESGRRCRLGGRAVPRGVAITFSPSSIFSTSFPYSLLAYQSLRLGEARM